MAAVTIGAHGDVCITERKHLSVIGLLIGRCRVGMARAAAFGYGKTCGQARRRTNRVRCMAIGTDRGIDVAATRRLLAVNRAMVVLEFLGVAGATDFGRFLAPCSRRRCRICVRNRGNAGVAISALEFAVQAVGKVVRSHEQWSGLIFGELCRKAGLAMAVQAGLVAEIGALRVRNYNAADED